MNTRSVRCRKQAILDSTADGLRFVGDDGVEGYIDFRICRKNWVVFVNSGGEFKDKHISEDDTRCVGRRDITGKPPYIEFFTEPTTRFEFAAGFWDGLFRTRQNRRDFQGLQHAIITAGWATLDMS